MVAVETLDLYEEAISLAIAAVEEGRTDPGYDVEFREDLDGVYAEDRDINNLAAISMAVRSGLPVTGWKPALRNPGNDERVERSATQFVRAAKGLLKEYEDGERPADNTSAAIANAYLRQARNAFIAGKRSLGNLSPLTLTDEQEIRKTAASIGLDGQTPREGSFGDVLTRALAPNQAPEDARSQIDEYINGLMSSMVTAGFTSASKEQREAMGALVTAATTGRTDAEAAYVAARDSQAPDLETWRTKFVAARQAQETQEERLQRLQGELKDAKAIALVSVIRKAQEGAGRRLNRRLGILLRQVLRGAIQPGDAQAEFRRIMSEEAAKAYVAGRKTGGAKRPGKKPTPEEQSDAEDEEEDFDDAWVYAGVAATAIGVGATGYGMAQLLNDVVFDPLNLVDPDVFNFVSRRLDNIATRFYNLNQLGQKAAFRLGGASLPAPSPLDGNVFDGLARNWEDTPGPVVDPTPLGSAVMVWWRLGEAAQHCNDCLSLADASPYNADEMEYMGLAPGSGHTECGAFCRCSLEFDIPSTVCVDGIVVQESTGGSLEQVAVMEAETCENHMDVSGLTVAGLGIPTGAVDEIQYIADDVAFDWDADVAGRITIDAPGVGVPAKRAWLADPPVPGHAPYVKRPGRAGAGPVLTQKFRYDDTVYTAVFQTDDNAVRFISGFVDEGDLAFENELTVAAVRYLAADAADAGKLLEFDPRLINPGMRSFLDEVGAISPTFERYPGSILPRGAGGPPAAERLLEWPGRQVPAAAKPTALPAVTGEIPFPVYADAWQFVDELEYVSNGKGVRQEFYHYIGDRGSLERYWTNEFGITIENIDDWTLGQLNDMTARLEFFREIGIDTSIFKRLRTITDGSFAGEALSDGTIRLSNTTGLGAKHTYANSLGDTLAHEFGHLVQYAGVDTSQLSLVLPRDFTPYGAWSYQENFAETFSAMFRPDYRVGTLSGDEAVWAAMREAGVVKQQPLRIPRVDLPPAPTGITDEAGNLIEGWKVAPETFRGSVTLKTLVGPDGARYVFKPAATQEEIAGAAVTRLFGYNAPDIAPLRLEGEWGIVYPLVGGDSLGPVFDELELGVAESLILDVPGQFSHAETRELFGHHMVDWLINNHDGHAGNILRLEDGTLVAIDKGRGFTNIGIRSDQTLYGATTGMDAYNGLIPGMLRTAKNADGTDAGLVLMRMLEPEDVRQVIARFDDISDESFLRLIEGIDDDVRDGLLKRKQNLRVDTEAMFERIRLRYPDNVSAQWKAWDGSFKDVRLKAPDDLPKVLKLDPDQILKPKESGFFKKHTPEDVRKAINALPEAQRAEAENLMRNVVAIWKKDFATIPQDWQVWHLQGGVFKVPSQVSPPSFGMSKPGAYIAKVQGKPYVPKPPRYIPEVALGYTGDNPPNFWGGLGDLTAKHPDGTKPKTSWDGDEWVIPRNGPMDETPIDIGYDLDLNAPLQEWSGDVPFDEPPLPDGIILDHQKKAAREAADKAFKSWDDVKSGDVDYARVWGGASDTKAAEAAGLIVEKMSDGNYYATTSNTRMKALSNAISDGLDTNSDEFWIGWLGHTVAELDAIDYYEDVKTWKSIRAGVLVIEDDGRMWFMAPRNQYAGYENTWSKGGIDPGETVAQGAVREAREEMGMSVEITGFLGDYANKEGTSMNRYFIGRRTGGGPVFASRKETYAMRLGTPEEIKPMLKRYGKADVRDTKVLDDYLAQEGLPPVPGDQPKSLGFAINDPPDDGINELAESLGYDPEFAGQIAAVYTPPKYSNAFTVDEISMPEGTLKVKVKRYVTQGEDSIVWDDLWMTNPIDGGATNYSIDHAVGAFIGVSKQMQDGQLLRIDNAALNARFKGLYDQTGFAVDEFGHIVLDSDDVAFLRSALENGKLPPALDDTVQMTSGGAADLANKLDPTDPLKPGKVEGGQQGFSAEFGLDKESLKQTQKKVDIASAQAHEIVSKEPGQKVWQYGYYDASGPVEVTYAFADGGATPVTLEDIVFPPAALVIDKQHSILAAAKHMAEGALNEPMSSWNAVRIPAAISGPAQLDELLTSIGATLDPSGSWWALDDTAMGNLIKGIDGDVLTTPISTIPTAPLNHLDQAAPANPMVAHKSAWDDHFDVDDVVPTSGEVPATAVAWSSDPDTSYKLVISDQKHWTQQAGSDNLYSSHFYLTEDATEESITIKWRLTKTGNIHIDNIGGPFYGFQDEVTAAAIQGFVHDSAVLMKSPMPGFAKHNALTMGADTFNALPQNVKDVLVKAGIHEGYKGNQVLGKSAALKLNDNIVTGLDGYVPTATVATPPVGAEPAAILPTPPPAPSMQGLPPLSEGVGYDHAWVTSGTQHSDIIVGTQKVVVAVDAKVVGENTLQTNWLPQGGNLVLQPNAYDALTGEPFGMGINELVPSLMGVLDSATAKNLSPSGLYGIQAVTVTEHAFVADVLKQVGGALDSQGNLWLDRQQMKAFRRHVIDETWPIPNANAAAPKPPGSALWDTLPLDGTPKDNVKTKFFVEPHVGEAADGKYVWNVVPDKYQIETHETATNVVLNNAILPAEPKEALTDAAVMSVLYQAQVDGKGFTVMPEVWTRMSPPLQQRLVADFGGLDIGPFQYTFSPENASAIADDLAQEMGVNVMKGVPPSLPHTTSIMDAGGFASWDAEPLVKATNLQVVEFVPTFPQSVGEWSLGSYKVQTETLGTTTTFVKITANVYDEAAYETTLFLQHAALGGNLDVVLHKDVMVELGDDFKAVLNSLGAEDIGGGHWGMDSDALKNFKAHLDVELANKPLPQPEIPTGVVGGQTVAEPAQAVLPPDDFHLKSDFDPLVQPEVKLGAATKTDTYPGNVNTKSNKMTLQDIELNGEVIGTVDWRRLGNRLEMHGISGGDNIGNAFVAFIGDINQRLIDNPKLTHLKVQNTNDWRGVFPELDAYLKGYEDITPDGKLTPDIVQAIVDDFDGDHAKALAFANAPPPAAAPSSPFAVVEGYNPSNVTTTLPISTTTIEPPYLAGAHHSKVKQVKYGGGTGGTTIEYRRIGYRMETFQIVPGPAYDPVYVREHTLAHIKSMTDEIASKEKMEGLVFVNPDMLPGDIRQVLDDMGATMTNKGRLKLDRQTSIAVNDALKADALTPGAPPATAAKVAQPMPTPPAPPPPLATAATPPPPTPVQAPTPQPTPPPVTMQPKTDWQVWTPQQHAAELNHKGIVTPSTTAVVGSPPDEFLPAAGGQNLKWNMGGPDYVTANTLVNEEYHEVTLNVIGSSNSGMYGTGGMLGTIQHTAARGDEWALTISDDVVGTSKTKSDILTSLGFTKGPDPETGAMMWTAQPEVVQHAAKSIDEIPSTMLKDPDGKVGALDFKPDPIMVPGEQKLPGLSLENHQWNHDAKVLKVTPGQHVGATQIVVEPIENEFGKGIMVHHQSGVSVGDEGLVKAVHQAIWNEWPEADIFWHHSYFYSQTPGEKMVEKVLGDLGGFKATKLDGEMSYYSPFKVEHAKKDEVLTAIQPKYLPEDVVTGEFLQKGAHLYDEGSGVAKQFKKATTKPPHIQGKSGPSMRKLSLTKGNHGVSAKLPYVHVGDTISGVLWTGEQTYAQHVGLYHLAKIAGDSGANLYMPLGGNLDGQLKMWAKTMGITPGADSVMFTPNQSKVITMLLDENIVPKAGVVPIFTKPNTSFMVGKIQKSKGKGKKGYWGGSWEFTFQGKAYQLTPKYGYGNGKGKIGVSLGSHNVDNPSWAKYEITGYGHSTADEEGIFWAGFLKAADYMDEQADYINEIMMVAPNDTVAGVLAAMGGQLDTSMTYQKQYTFKVEDVRKIKKAIKKGTLPEGTPLNLVPPPAAATPPVSAYTPPPAAAVPPPAATPPPPTPAAPAPPKVAKKPKAPPPAPKPDTAVWVPPKQGAAAQSTTSPVKVPDSVSTSKKFGYEHEEVKEFTAVGASEIDLGTQTTNVIEQDAWGFQYITPGGRKVQAKFSRTPEGNTVAFTGIEIDAGISPQRAEAAYWASLEEFARMTGEKVYEDGTIHANAKLYITSEMLENRPELKQMLLDMGAVEFNADGTGDALKVFNVATGEDVASGGVQVGTQQIKGRAFWRAYGDGLYMDRDTAKKLADLIDTNTFDEALQVDVLAAKPPDPITTAKAFPSGVSESQPIRYMGLHPDHLYLARNEQIRQVGPSAVSVWAGGKVEATWLRTPSIMHWKNLEVVGEATAAEVRASTIRHLRNLVEAQMNTPGMALDIHGPALDAIPDLQDILLRWKGRMVGSGEKRFIRLNYQDAQTFYSQFNSELLGIAPKGLAKPVVDPVIWPSPKELAPKASNLKGQTTKHVFTDLDGQEWLFKPGKTGRGTHADVAAFQLSQHFGLHVPPVKTYTLTVNGVETTGSLQKMVPAVEVGARRDDAGAALRKLDPDQMDEVLRHSVLDRLIGNDDSHIENFLIGPGGEIWAIDKTRGWKGFGTAKDSLNPSGVGQGGGGLPPLINIFWREAAKDPRMLENVSPKAMGRILRYTESLPEQEFLRIVSDVIDDVAQVEKRWGSKDAFKQAMLERKRGLKVEYEQHFKRQLQKMLDDGKSLPPDWQAFMDEGAEFKLLMTPHEQGEERLMDLRKKFNSGNPLSGPLSETTVTAWFKSASPEIDKEVTEVLKRAYSYSGGGTSVTDAAGNLLPKKGYGAEGIPQGGQRGFDHVTEVNEMIVLELIHNPNFTISGYEGFAEEIRRSYNPDTGQILLRRGVQGKTSPTSYWNSAKTRGFRPVLGTSFGSTSTGYASGGVQMTMKLNPNQVFLSSIWSRGRFSHASEREVIIRDLVLENILHMDSPGHSWQSEFGLSYSLNSTSSAAQKAREDLYAKLWALDGGPTY